MTPEQIERAAGLSGEEITGFTKRPLQQGRLQRPEAEAMQEHCRKICRK